MGGGGRFPVLAKWLSGCDRGGGWLSWRLPLLVTTPRWGGRGWGGVPLRAGPGRDGVAEPGWDVLGMDSPRRRRGGKTLVCAVSGGVAVRAVT